jgi:Ca2+-binding EF-hand superfamily protein
MRWLVLVLAALGAEKTPPGVTEKQMEEFGKDFKDFDKNQDDLVDPQEVRHGFGGKLSEAELFEFYRDADVDMSGSVDLAEYVVYAATMA